jgi:beta-xylosidase
VETGWQGAFRSRDFFGPYEERIVLAQGETAFNGPHQGAWVTDPGGGDWFLHFQHLGAFGRVVHLQPMRWDADGWPVLGDDGQPVAEHAVPVPGGARQAPATDDDFPGGTHGPQWTWLANPGHGWTRPHQGEGLRLACVPTADAHDLRRLANVLAQRLPVGPRVVEVELSLESEAPGAKAGLAVLGDAFSWIGLERDGEGGGVRLVHRFAEPVAEYERDAAHAYPAPGGRARLRVEIAADARCRFAAALAGGPFRASGQEFAAKPWRWVGAQLGLFATAPPRAGEDAGAASFRSFRITP